MQEYSFLLFGKSVFNGNRAYRLMLPEALMQEHLSKRNKSWFLSRVSAQTILKEIEISILLSQPHPMFGEMSLSNILDFKAKLEALFNPPHIGRIYVNLTT